jgi:hypothetical protein
MLPACIVIGCVNATHNPAIKYYRIPANNPNICKQWYINTLREDLPHVAEHCVCVEHFDEESFYPNQQLLKDDAVPSLFEIEVFQKMITHQELINTQRNNNSHSSTVIQQIQQQQATKQPLLTNLILNQQVSGQLTVAATKCSIRTCANHFDNNKASYVELYALPKTVDIAKKWQLACNAYNDDNLRVCREHFLKTDFNEFNYLKPDAVPSQFLYGSLKRPRGDVTGDHGVVDRVSTNTKANKRHTNTTGSGPASQAKIQKAVKHTNSILSLSGNNFLSAALNVQPIAHVGHPAPRQTTPKAVKHTTTTAAANNLLKDILPPPIMQSTKRAAKAVKHTGGYYPNGNAAHHATPRTSNNGAVDLLTQKLNQFVAQKTPTVEQQQQLPPHKVTYIYKRVNQPHEIELFLECEDDDCSAPTAPPVHVVDMLASKDPNSSKHGLDVLEKKKKAAMEHMNQKPPTYKPIASMQALEKSSSHQHHQQQTNAKTKAVRRPKDEKRHMQTLMKYYSRKPPALPKSGAQAKSKHKGKCSICDLVLDNNIELTSHICSHLEGVNYISPFDAVTTTCSVCDVSFANPFELIKHLDDEHMKQLCEYKCRICEKQHHSMNDLYKHLDDVHVKNEMPYNCEGKCCTGWTRLLSDWKFQMSIGVGWGIRGDEVSYRQLTSDPINRVAVITTVVNISNQTTNLTNSAKSH